MLVCGTLERRIECDYILDLYSSVKTPKMQKILRATLEMAVYQIIYMDKVYESLACNVAVNIIKRRKLGSLAGFANAVLRKVVTNKDNIPYPKEEDNPALYLGVKYSMPPVVLKMLMRDYSLDEVKRILENIYEIKGLSVRVRDNVSKEEEEALVEAWKKAGSSVESASIDKVYILGHTDNIRNLAGFDDGKIMIQDIGSILAGRACNYPDAEVIIDMCAAPGSKSVQLADMHPNAKVYSFDVSERKVDLIKENISRLGIKNIETKVNAGTIYNPEFENKADVILCDVPCSGLGVMGRKQDIKYRINEEEIKSIIALQKAIVTNAAKYLKKGGHLIYSTCTINKDENERMATWISKELGLKAEPDSTIVLLPGDKGSDGFFVTAFVKS
jgi:16S rRNA (cytosine967-C5)-methyltransferase